MTRSKGGKLERKFSADDVMPFLESLPNSWWRNITVKVYGKKGTPDIIGCYQGKFYAFELKQVGEEPEPLQEYNIEKIVNSGGVAIVIDNIEQLRSLLK